MGHCTHLGVCCHARTPLAGWRYRWRLMGHCSGGWGELRVCMWRVGLCGHIGVGRGGEGQHLRHVQQVVCSLPRTAVQEELAASATERLTIARLDTMADRATGAAKRAPCSTHPASSSTPPPPTPHSPEPHSAPTAPHSPQSPSPKPQPHARFIHATAPNIDRLRPSTARGAATTLWSGPVAPPQWRRSTAATRTQST